MKKSDREQLRRRRRQENEARRIMNRDNPPVFGQRTQIFPAVREPEIIETRVIRRKPSIVDLLLRALRPWFC